MSRAILFILLTLRKSAISVGKKAKALAINEQLQSLVLASERADVQPKETSNLKFTYNDLNVNVVLPSPEKSTVVLIPPPTPPQNQNSYNHNEYFSNEVCDGSPQPPGLDVCEMGEDGMQILPAKSSHFSIIGTYNNKNEDLVITQSDNNTLEIRRGSNANNYPITVAVKINNVHINGSPIELPLSYPQTYRGW